MNRTEKYDEIRSMESIGQHTAGKHPSKTAFFRALAEGRVAGDYEKGIRIVSNDANRSYQFVWRCHHEIT